jgi:predicted MPP superfamily phosphohydrolase
VDILADDALGPDHARCRRWVVFSDLHLNRKTSEVCVDVLRAVHREALARDAGILFLGDFWHARGAIPVEPLIEALDAVREWTVPCVMIPGNHDQVTAGGEIHALTPLAAANPARVKILSRPTVWRNALWLPYRRDGGVIKSAVAKAKSEIVSSGGRYAERHILPRRRHRRLNERNVPGQRRPGPLHVRGGVQRGGIQ